MEQPDYEFPKRMSKADYAVIVGAIVVCTLLIALCMVGVIA